MRPNPSSRTIWPFDVLGDIFGKICASRGHVRCAVALRAVLGVMVAGMLLTSALSATAQVVKFIGVHGGQPVEPRPQVVGATASQTNIGFNPVAVAVPAASAQIVQASFAVSGYTGSFTPTAAMHFGHDYTVGAATCTSTGSATETCTFPITFIPTLPGTRKDAIVVSNGSTVLTSVLVYGIGQGPLGAVQPGIISQLAPSPSGSYLGAIAVDGNNTVYVVGYQDETIYTYTSTGGLTALPITGISAPDGVAIDGAGTLYLSQNTYSHNVITYTAAGVQGTMTLQYPPPNGTNDNYPYAVAVDGPGDVFVLDILNGIYEFKTDGTYATTAISPAITQPDDIVLDDSGNLFISGYQINELTPGGTQTQINTTGYRAISIDASDTLYVSGGPLPGIQELVPTNYSGSATENSFGNPVDLTGTGLLSGPDGTVYYSDAAAGLSKVDRSQGLLSFGEQSAGTTSTAQAATIVNIGNEPMTISSVTLSGAGFATVPVTGTNCTNGLMLAPSASCQVSVNLTPTHAGNWTGTLTFTSNSLNNASTTQVVNLTGFVYGPYVIASPSPLAFASQTINTTSAAQMVTLTNQGLLYSAGIGTPTSTSTNFAPTLGTCTAQLAPGSTCQLSITFTPAAAQSYTGTITSSVSSTGGGANTSVSFSVTGTGTAPPTPQAVLTPPSFAYPSTTVGASTTQAFNLSNPGTAALTGIAPTLTGANTADFSISNACTGTLQPEASCTISVSFMPQSAAAFAATLSVADNATGSPQTSGLTGTGTAATAPIAALTPNPVTFPATPLNQVNVATVTLTNSGNATLTGISIAITGTSATAFSIYPTSTCGTTLAAGANCSIILHFYPTTAGSYSATLSVTDSASGSPQTTALSGLAYAQTAQTQFTPAELNAIAGTGSAPANCANLAEPGPALQTQLCNPTAVAVDLAGNVYIVEQQDNVVKKLGTNGNVTTFAGIENTGPGSFSGDNGPANAANLSSPLDVAVDPYGNVYISDYGNGRIREVNATTGIITTFVGGASGQYFNGGTGTGVTLSPAGIAFDPSGNLYIAEPNQQIVVKVTPTGAASLFAGVQTAGGPGTAGYNGDNIQATTAELNYPTSVTTDRNGNIYIADSQNYRVRYINENFEPGMISTAAGNGTKGDTGDGGSSISAEINPLSITINEAYELFISDGSTIRKVNGQGTINTFAGGGTGGLGGPATSALLQGVGQPGIDNNGNLLIPVSTTPEVLSAGPTGILQFGNQAVGTPSAPLTVTIENTGSTYLNDFSETPLTATGPFEVTGGTCGQETDGGYSPGQGCTLIVTFTPTATGAQTGSITVPSNAPNSPQSIVLQGTGTAVAAPQATLTPSGLSFPNTIVGATSAVQTLTLSNPGNASLTISGITVTGTNIADFAQTNTCTGTLAAGATCAINVTFTPASAASFSASISVADNATGSPQTATLTGTGTAAPAPQAFLTPPSLYFSNTTTGSTSAAQTLTLSNQGNAALTISGISLTGTNTADFAQTNTCGGTLAAGATCAINVTFTPASATSFSASASVADNAAGSPQTAMLSGTGVAPVTPADFSTSSPTPPQTVSPGGTAQFSVAVQPTNGSFTGVVTLSATGLPPDATASFQPATVTPGSSGATSTLTIQTAAQQASGASPQHWPLLPPGISIALVAPLFWWRFRRGNLRPGQKILLGAIIFALVGTGAVFLTGCGAGFALPSKSTPTTYTITVTGTSGSDTHSTTVTLILQ